MSQSDSDGEIRKLTPLERVIAEKTDRRRAFDARKEREGFKRVTVWVREDRVEEVKRFAQSVNDD